MSVLAKLQELGLELPAVAQPVGAYVPAVRFGEMIFTSGQLPLVGGSLCYAGKVGKDLSETDGYEAARICVLNGLAAAASVSGGLDNILRVIKVTGFINCDVDFSRQANVLNGASDLLGKLFDADHARSAVGVAALPLNAALEVEMIVAVRE